MGDKLENAANAVVLSEVEPDSTCVGVPARVVKRGKVRVAPASVDLDQIHMPDPVSMELCKLLVKLETLEKRLTEDEQKNLMNQDSTEV